MSKFISTLMILMALPLMISFTTYEGGGDEKDGRVSWYGGKFHGRLTASGEVYNMNKLTCAHKTLPFGTLVEVTNPRNGKKVTVKVNDRGPFVKNREFDLSRAAFNKISNTNNGVIKIKYKILD